VWSVCAWRGEFLLKCNQRDRRAAVVAAELVCVPRSRSRTCLCAFHRVHARVPVVGGDQELDGHHRFLQNFMYMCLIFEINILDY